MAEAMISALKLKDRIEMANADDDQVDVCRVGFLAYVRGDADRNRPQDLTAFEAFIRKLRERYRTENGSQGVQ